MSCDVGYRHGSDPVLLWLWRRLETTALSQPLAWEPSYAAGAALEKTQRQKQTKKRPRRVLLGILQMRELRFREINLTRGSK